MRRRYKILIFFVVAVIASAAYYTWWQNQPEVVFRQQIDGVIASLSNGSLQPADFPKRIQEIGVEGQDNIPALVNLVAEKDSLLETAEASLVKQFPKLEKVFPKALFLEFRRKLAEDVLLAGLTARADAKVIASMMHHENHEVRKAATQAMLRDIRGGWEIPLKAFYPEIDNQDSMVRNAVIIAVIKKGPQGKDAESYLLKALNHAEEITCYHAAAALMAIGGPTNLAMATFERLSKSSSSDVSYQTKLILVRQQKDDPFARIIRVNGINVIPPDELIWSDYCGLSTPNFLD